MDVDMNMKFQIDAMDWAGVYRVYGVGQSETEAIAQCELAARTYLAGRPDISGLQLVKSDPNGGYRTIKKIYRA